MTKALELLTTAAMCIREEVARARAFNTGICLGMKLKEEAELYNHYKHLDVVPERLSKAAKLIDDAMAELNPPDSKVDLSNAEIMPDDDDESRRG